MVKKNNIPEGWRNVQPVGQPIPGTRFIAFKVPLKGVINQRLTPTQKFTPKDLIAAMKALNVELGLIIDLTYTTRYYGVKDLPKNVEYKKLFTVGREVPDDATILLFKKWVRKFLWENAENEKLIGVHCTNGINRTGYLICRYLIDVEGWDPKTAIRAFGEARGHYMDSKKYVLDLKTQPMRSNLGMNLWDADGDTVPPPNNVDGHIDRLSSEEYPRPAKRLKVYDDDHSDLPEQIRLREFDFINKGPGQQRKPYYDQQFQDDPEPLVKKRQSHFADHRLYDGCQEEMQLKDFDFATRGSGKRLRSYHDRHLHDEIPESAQLEDMNMGHGQRHFPDVFPHSDMLIDSQFNRDQGKRQRQFYDPQSNDEYQSHQQFKKLAFHNKRPEQRMRPSQDCSPHDDTQTPVGEFEFVRRGHGQQILPFLDHKHHNDLQTPVEDFYDRDSESRCRPFHKSQSYDDFSEQMQLDDFLNRETKQRMKPFGDHSPCDDMQYKLFIERDCPFFPQDRFPETPLFCRDYGSDNEDYHRNCRPDCSADCRRTGSSDELIRERKTRFAPCSSRPVHITSSSHQEVSSVAVDHEREPHCEITREMGPGKKLPIVTIDYNYGLPLNYIVEEDEAQHDSHRRECLVRK